MRASKWIAFGLAALLAASSLSACNALRTPYERTKIQEEGGIAKKDGEEGGGKKKEGEQGGEKGGGDVGTSSAEQQDKAKTAAAEKKKADDKAASRPGRAETKAQERERVKGQGLLYVVPQNVPAPQPPKPPKKDEQQARTQAVRPQQEQPPFAHEADLSKQAARVEGVDGATVLLDKEHNAYVAMTADLGKTMQGSGDKPEVRYNPKLDVKTEGEIPQQLQEKTAEKLREVDPKVETVHITADPKHVAAFQRYLTEAAKEGDEAKMNLQAAAEHIQDIWK